MSATQFSDFASPLIGLPVSHVWRGYGSALFLEFGALSQRTKRDGSAGDPLGKMSLMIEWSWRIEGRKSILCGSWSDDAKWPKLFGLLRNKTVVSASLFGRLPEIELCLSNDVRILSFMTADGDPNWTLFDRHEAAPRWMFVRCASLYIDSELRTRAPKNVER